VTVQPWPSLKCRVEKSPFPADVVYNRRVPPPRVRTSPTRPGDSSPCPSVWTGSPHFPLTHSYSLHPPPPRLFLLRHARGAPPSLPGGAAARWLSPCFALLHHYSSQRTRLRLSPRRANDLLSVRISHGGGPIGLSIAAATRRNPGKLPAHHKPGRGAPLLLLPRASTSRSRSTTCRDASSPKEEGPRRPRRRPLGFTWPVGHRPLCAAL
jgi:hypothetical protein